MIRCAILCLIALSSDLHAQIDFDSEIIPVLTLAGCNAGACHGAAAGRGNFQLSLWGSDPASDYSSIVQAFEGRRINLVRPDRSLILLKPTGQIEHGGGAVLDSGDPGLERIEQWIRSGVPRGSARNISSFLVQPQQIQLAMAPMSFELRATARFSDGVEQDVTEWTLFVPDDPSAISVYNGVATVHRRGQHILLARFLNKVAPIVVTAPLFLDRVDYSGEPRANFIDDEVLEMLAQLAIPLSQPASDSEFLRRVTLDLTGRLPAPDETIAFLQDNDPEKRERRIDQLLASEAFVEFWTLRLARLMRIRSLPNEPQVAQAYVSWVQTQLRQRAGWDEMARQLVTATGDSHQNGAANFARLAADARQQAAMIGELFMGVRLGCANCHNHPSDKWTQDDYHGLAAIFAPLDRGRTVAFTSRGGVTNLRTNEPAVAKIPGGSTLNNPGDRRSEISAWLTSEDNPYFARSMVNRLWSTMFGRGLIEPVDDLRETNPATHPNLLSRLSDDFIANDFDIRHTLRMIALSRAYARSSQPIGGNEIDVRFYSHSYRRGLMPEVLADAISDLTGVRDVFPGFPPGTRALSVVDPLVPSRELDVLGRCPRGGTCVGSTESSESLATQLHLLNGELINSKITNPSGRLHQLIRDGASDEAIINEFFLRAWGREPFAFDAMHWRAEFSTSPPDERARRLEDFVWSLLVSSNFSENH